MRELITVDLYRVSKILQKMDLKLDANADKTQTQIGADLILSAFGSLHKAELEVNEFFGSLVNMTAQEFAELPIPKTLDIIKEFISISGIESFLRRAGQFAKLKL